MAGCLIVMTRLFGGAGIWWSPLVSEAVCLVVTGLLLMRYCRKDSFWNQKVQYDVFDRKKVLSYNGPHFLLYQTGFSVPASI